MSTPLWRPLNLAEWALKAPSEPQWIIKDWIPDDSIVVLSGHQKRAFKTWLAARLSMHVACGHSCPDFDVVKGGPVLYVYEEGSVWGTRDRMAKLAKGMGLSLSDMTNFYLVHRERVKLDDRQWVAKLTTFVAEVRPVMVVLDTLTYMHHGDENNTKEMGAVTDALQQLRQAGPTIMVLAHLDKTRGGNPRADIDDQVRGSSVLVNAYDVHLALRRYKASDMTIQITVRGRDLEERGLKISWTIDDECATHYLEREDDDEHKTEQLAVEALKSLDSGARYHLGAIKRLWDCSETVTLKWLKLLELKGLVEQEGHKWYVK